jgi:hypothetical protein
MGTLLTIQNYIQWVLPGFVLIILFFLTIKPSAHLRIAIYIFAFVLMRDALTPLNLWRLGKGENYIWIRFHEDALFIIIFGLCSLSSMLALFFLDKENRKYLVWKRGSLLKGIVGGIVGCVVVIMPFWMIYAQVDIGLRGGAVRRGLILPILTLAILGNLLEEGLFRGYVLGFLKKTQSETKAGITSGIVFAFCHIFLALTVTQIGMPLLLFTLWEGVIAGLVGTKFGIIPATLTHGGAIFLLSSGLI